MTRRLNVKKSLQRFKMVFYGVEDEGKRTKEEEEVFNLSSYAQGRLNLISPS